MTTLFVLSLLIHLDLLLQTGRCTETQDQILSITPKTQEQVYIVRNISTQFETGLWQPVSPHYIQEDSQVHLFVPANSSGTVKTLLQRSGVTHEILLENANELIEMQTRNDSTDPRSSATFYERYHTLEDIYSWINRTANDNPNTVKVILIGSSYEKRPLYALKLSMNNIPGKKAMWLDCGIHAREWISPAFCLWFVHYSLSFYRINADITHILDSMDVYVLPVLNPDGYRYTWTTNRMWRKNRSVSPASSCIGVDLNRNFDANWCTEGASPDPCTEIYCGAFPESEPEAQAVADFLRSHKDSVQLYLTIHSYSQLLLFPFSYKLEETENHRDLLEMTQEAAQKIRRYYRNVYRYGAGAKTIYLAPGGSDDWAYNLGIKYSFTFELQDRGRYGFLLPPSHISGACNEALLATKIIALKVLEKTQAPAKSFQTV
ncbi:carboxypeptidase B2-like [Salarias fasciatus]|uniref:carboxypeptidase B2-like n=1 Tax=Salarias fasciatus TaxID=181472 RepID=UPI001176F135|nr:carboxypeptidase B2-like [Salarias fasciatus]XP_029942872.1 carboxypeptidase B2-like [Salarias fasciatus]